MAGETEARLLEVGTDAPDFTLISAYGEPFTLSELRGRMNACLFFYPEHETPQNSRQLAAARDDRERFIGADIERIGLNPGSLEENQRLAQLHELDFPLLVDADLEVARKYGAAPPDRHHVERIVYVVDKEGKIAFARRGTPTTEEILEALDR
ncbi:MAG TPA: redoxin domain-containing protein [Longimicrobiales bacterium]